MSRRLVLGLAVTLLIGLAVAALLSHRGFVVVPPKRFAIAGSRILAPGWHLTSPFVPATLLDLQGDGALPPVPLPNREGVKAEALLSFHYLVRPEVLAEASRRRGL